MTKNRDELSRLVGQIPWLTEDGTLDLAKFPIDLPLRQALSSSPDEYGNGLRMLRSMHSSGRQEAGVFLVGLLVSSGDDWQKRTEIVEALRRFRTKACADLLMGEIKRVKGSNTTRRYLDAVIRTLASLPPELVRPGLLALIADKTVSARTREKLEEALWETGRRTTYEEEE